MRYLTTIVMAVGLCLTTSAQSHQITYETIMVSAVNQDGSLKLHDAWMGVDYSPFDNKIKPCVVSGSNEEFYLYRQNKTFFLCVKQGNNYVPVYRSFQNFAIDPVKRGESLGSL